MINLDRFKLINDTLGYAVGDALLCLIAQRLRREVREDDLLARIGGDEFAALLTSGVHAEALAARVLDSLTRPFLVEGHIVTIAASIGIARFPQPGSDADDLMRHAHLALDAAKTAGRRIWRVFVPAMEGAATCRRAFDTTEQAALGEVAGCTEFRGYPISQPTEAAEIEGLLKRYKPAAKS
jgi:diguanylate cyclase (GGDEF)-like protein